MRWFLSLALYVIYFDLSLDKHRILTTLREYVKDTVVSEPITYLVVIIGSI